MGCLTTLCTSSPTPSEVSFVVLSSCHPTPGTLPTGSGLSSAVDSVILISLNGLGLLTHTRTRSYAYTIVEAIVGFFQTFVDRARLSLRNSQCAAYATVFPGKEYQAGDKVSGYTVVKVRNLLPHICPVILFRWLCLELFRVL